jgi:hypothetical protein
VTGPSHSFSYVFLRKKTEIKSRSLLYFIVAFLFQLLPSVKGQSLSVSISFGTDTTPGNLKVSTIAYDEPNNVVYTAGEAFSAFDGLTYKGGAGDAFIIKHFVNGTRIWSKLLGGTLEDIAFKLLLNPSTSEIIMVGNTVSLTYDGVSTFGGPDAVIVKYASNGTKIFCRLWFCCGRLVLECRSCSWEYSITRIGHIY